MDRLTQDLIASGMIHYPMELHSENSLEAEGAKKKVLKERKLGSDSLHWKSSGECIVETLENGVRMKAAFWQDRRPSGDLELGDCGSYGSNGADCEIPRENWEEYNRISFTLKVEAQGMRKICARLCLRNDGLKKLPDQYFRDGFHSINVDSGTTNRIRLEIPTTPRDCITGISILFYCGGCETHQGAGNCLIAEAKDFTLEKVENPEIALGWEPAENAIVYSFSGYRPKAEKVALILNHCGESFAVRNQAGEELYTGCAMDSGFHGISILDFSAVETCGEVQLCLGTIQSDFFPIREDIWTPSIWKTINFLFCERCGYPVPGIHQTCHRDVIAKHNGKSFVFNGGWHDAGDLSQQLIQSAEVCYSLFELAQALPEEKNALRQRILEEALWGLDYVLKSRFGDGYRATSVGTGMWSQGFAGDADDITARMHNNAYENFLCALVECFAAKVIARDDPGLSNVALCCAEQDYHFAKERFAQTGFSERPPIYWEHSWMTSESAFMATMAQAASLLFGSTGKVEYMQDAAEDLRYVLSCQKTDACGTAFSRGGFFYRNPEKRAIVHFNHQARDQIYAQALSAAMDAMPQHPDYPLWKDALCRFADYLKELYTYASPYGMIPAGVYHVDEWKDSESFHRLHLLTGSEAEQHYALQLQEGISLGDGYYIRQFPVWFSFRGNNAILLSLGKAAAICGKTLKDEKLMQIAERQLAWVVGMNPFRQSLMYGEGKRYPQQYAAMSGEATGEIPVGIQTFDDEDVPYWPQMNNATYKEVWTTPAGRWVSILADLL